MAGFRDLRVWRDSKDLCVAVYGITSGGLWERDWSLRDQVRRSAVSVPSNIAEGEARNSQKDSIRFFKISLGSLAELSTQLEIANEISYLKDDEHDSLQVSIATIQLSLGALVRKRKEQL